MFRSHSSREGLGSDLDVAEKGQVRALHQTDFLQNLPLLLHLQLVAGLTYNCPLEMHVYGDCVIPGWSQTADIIRLDGMTIGRDEVHLVEKADAY